MFSWFQVYFAFEEPLLVRKENKLKVLVWRCVNKQSVWYEWQAELLDGENKIKVTKVHNMNGKVHAIGK